MLAFVPLLAAVEVGIDNTVFKTHTHTRQTWFCVLCFFLFLVFARVLRKPGFTLMYIDDSQTISCL